MAHPPTRPCTRILVQLLLSFSLFLSREMPDAFRFHFLTLLCVCVRVCVRAWRAYRFARDYAIHSFSRVYCELKTRRYFIEHFDFSAQILASFCIFDANATTDECPTQSRKRRKGYNAGKRLTLVRIHTSVCLCNDIDIGGESTRAFAQRVARARARGFTFAF